MKTSSEKSVEFSKGVIEISCGSDIFDMHCNADHTGSVLGLNTLHQICDVSSDKKKFTTNHQHHYNILLQFIWVASLQQAPDVIGFTENVDLPKKLCECFLLFHFHLCVNTLHLNTHRNVNSFVLVRSVSEKRQLSFCLEVHRTVNPWCS